MAALEVGRLVRIAARDRIRTADDEARDIGARAFVDAVVRMLRRIVAHASREALVERIAAEEVVELGESALYVSRVRLDLVGHEQDVTLRQRVLRAGPGVLVLCERTAKAVGLDLPGDVIGVAEKGGLDLCLQGRVGILRLEVSELAECQRVVPGEEARLLREAVRDGLEVLLVLLVARRAEELCGEPDALLDVRALVVRARATLLAFVDAVDGVLRLGEVAQMRSALLRIVSPYALSNGA